VDVDCGGDDWEDGGCVCGCCWGEDDDGPVSRAMPRDDSTVSMSCSMPSSVEAAMVVCRDVFFCVSSRYVVFLLVVIGLWYRMVVILWLPLLAQSSAVSVFVE